MPRVSPSTVRPAGTLQRESLHSTPLRAPTSQPRVLQTRPTLYKPLYPLLPTINEFWDVDAPEDDNIIEPRPALFKSTPSNRLPPISEYWDDDEPPQYIPADIVQTSDQPVDVQHVLYNYGEIETCLLYTSDAADE